MSRKSIIYILSLIVLMGMLLVSCKPAPTEEMPVDSPQEDVSVDAPTEAPADSPAGEAPTQVQFCILFSDSITENGWDRSSFESYHRVAENPGMDIEVLELRYVEGWMGDEGEAALREFAESGCDIIWDHTGYNDILVNIDQEYPDVMFVQVGSGFIVDDADVNNYFYMHRCYDGAYLMGVLAGLMTEGTAIGAAGTFPAEDVNDNVNAFFEGAKSIKPDLEQKVGFINSWYDPVAAGELGAAQKAAGADMLFMLAENFDVCGEGQDAMCFAPYMDFSEFYPGAVMASFIATWDEGYKWALSEWYKAKTTGEWSGAWPGFENKMDTGACYIQLGAGIEETLPADVLEQYYATQEGIMDGSIVPTMNLEEPVSE